jgi:hypothetical protein
MNDTITLPGTTKTELEITTEIILRDINLSTLSSTRLKKIIEQLNTVTRLLRKELPSKN